MSVQPQGSSANGKGKSPFPTDFFEALNLGNENKAMEILNTEAFTDGVPSPRTQKLIEAGKWDGHQKVSLSLIESDACAGRVGQDNKEIRFCGKPPNICTIQSHERNTVGTIRRGWYINMGKVQGLIASPYLPPIEEGGPITGFLAGRLLTSGDHGFRLTKGMWEFIIDAWYALKVESVSSESDGEEEITFNATTVQEQPKKLRLEIPPTTTWKMPGTIVGNEVQLKKPPPAATLGTLPNATPTDTASVTTTEPDTAELAQTIRSLVERYTMMANQARLHERRMLELEEQLRQSQRAHTDTTNGHEQIISRLQSKIIWMEDALEDVQHHGSSQAQGQDSQQTLDRLETIHNAIFAEHGELN